MYLSSTSQSSTDIIQFDRNEVRHCSCAVWCIRSRLCRTVYTCRTPCCRTSLCRPTLQIISRTKCCVYQVRPLVVELDQPQRVGPVVALRSERQQDGQRQVGFEAEIGAMFGFPEFSGDGYFNAYFFC
jgi:hypothetical protein